MKYKAVTDVIVHLDFGDIKHQVGRLALRNQKIYFEYDSDFLKQSLSISPLHLPLKSTLSVFDLGLFEGLPGVFNDSLPDGWGRLLLDRSARSHGILPSAITPLDRLTHVGRAGIGALTYEPDYHETKKVNHIALDQLAHDAKKILMGESHVVLETLLALNGSSAGARPKIMTGVNATKTDIIAGTELLPKKFNAWIIKFFNQQDGHDAGAIEYVYSLMAKMAGLQMSDTHLFPAKNHPGYFGTRRFDRLHHHRLHMHTASGLLHADFRYSSIDYQDLFTLTEMLTRDLRVSRRLFQQAVFNVLAHNRDDHSKNFSFLMNAQGEWTLSPAYDLTFSSGPGGEHCTTVCGKGRDILQQDLVQLGRFAKLNDHAINDIIAQTKDALRLWTTLAKQYDVSKENIQFIGKQFQ